MPIAIGPDPHNAAACFLLAMKTPINQVLPDRLATDGINRPSLLVSQETLEIQKNMSC